MSNPLASAEARQRKWNIQDGKDFADRMSFGFKNVETRLKYRNQVAEMWDEAHAELAESYADLVRERDEFTVKATELFERSVGEEPPYQRTYTLDEISGAIEQQIELRKHLRDRWHERRRELTERAEAAESLNRELVAVLQRITEMQELDHAIVAAEAAINSATPKQGEPHESV